MIGLTLFCRKNIAVFGLGKSGIASAMALVASDAQVVVWDDRETARQNAADLGLDVIDFHIIDWERIDFLLLSPGVPLYYPQPHWVIELARAAQVEVIGDIEFFVRARDIFLENNGLSPQSCPLICVTGTNGKSTTTALITHLLQFFCYDVQQGGNIGHPVLSLSPFTRDRFYILEISSYQIELSPSLYPMIGILLNVTPDHIDRHGSFAHYAAVKAQLVQRSDVAVIALDDPITKKLQDELGGGKQKLLTISTQGEKATYDLQEQMIYRCDKGDRTAIVNVAHLPALRGKHNVQNILAACAAIDPWIQSAQTKNPALTLRVALESFQGLPHRMEQIADLNNILFINDSKATNAEASAPALASFDQLYWIVGGLPKEGGIQSLEKFFTKIVKAYLIGEAQTSFATTLRGKVAYSCCETLDNALAQAVKDIQTSSTKQQAVILFSPACASFDQFQNYEERGNYFRQLVMQYQ